jgi:hypothetical protein
MHEEYVGNDFKGEECVRMTTPIISSRTSAPEVRWFASKFWDAGAQIR